HRDHGPGSDDASDTRPYRPGLNRGSLYRTDLRSGPGRGLRTRGGGICCRFGRGPEPVRGAVDRRLWFIFCDLCADVDAATTIGNVRENPSHGTAARKAWTGG